ncbi:hypothetical protein, partial [Serratia marcescens]|uniref:hypothetical protein n=1 Tax=Serratia marcescens TaxID=615 RepID=UPI001952D955
MYVGEELDYVASDSGARIALIGDELVDRFAGLVPGRLDHIIVARYADAAPSPCGDPLPEVMQRPAMPLPDGPYIGFEAAIAAGHAPD